MNIFKLMPHGISFIISINLFWVVPLNLISQTDPNQMTDMMDTMKMDSKKELIQSFRYGFMQTVLSVQDGNTRDFTDYEFYSMGFPVSFTFNTGKKVLFDLELVPIVKPYFGGLQNVEVSLLFHPGFITYVSPTFQVGLRGALETGPSRYGFTPLISKIFDRKKGNDIYLQLSFPGRFDKERRGVYRQEITLQVGVAL